MKYISIIIALGLLATACTKEFDIPQEDLTSTPITITARYCGDEQPATRVAYSESGSDISATWQSGDQIYVVYNGHVNTLDLTDGADTATATFSGSITGSPKATSVLICYVKDQNNPDAVNINTTGEYTYAAGAFLGQDGTAAGAARCNLYFGTTTYGDGSNISCDFSVNTSICKFSIQGIGSDATRNGALEYRSGSATVARASWKVTNGENLVYLAVPAGNYSGLQKVVYTCGSKVKGYILSASSAHFAVGNTYSKTIKYAPLTLEATHAGSIVIQQPKSGMKYSKNGGGKQTITDGESFSISVSAGDKVQFYGNGTSITRYDNTQIVGSDNVSVIAYGNIMSLVDETGYDSNTTLPAEFTFYGLFRNNTTLTDASGLQLPVTTLSNSCYSYMFYGCNALTASPVLPATTLAEFCYANMFNGCTSMTTAPALSAETLAENCYSSMFRGCTGLTTAPALPAETLADYCYSHMFYGCTALTTAPELLATTLTTSCYRYMFNGCSNLRSITCLATKNRLSNCTTAWVGGVAFSGTFTKAKGQSWPTGTAGIPNKWEVMEK